LISAKDSGKFLVAIHSICKWLPNWYLQTFSPYNAYSLLRLPDDREKNCCLRNPVKSDGRDGSLGVNLEGISTQLVNKEIIKNIYKIAIYLG
jgi:hypothetical protein